MPGTGAEQRVQFAAPTEQLAPELHGTFASRAHSREQRQQLVARTAQWVPNVILNGLPMAGRFQSCRLERCGRLEVAARLAHVSAQQPILPDHAIRSEQPIQFPGAFGNQAPD